MTGRQLADEVSSQLRRSASMGFRTCGLLPGGAA
jgi:hypothetical protein